jgi:MFS family permease
LQPIVLGAWFPRIPQIQATLDLSAGQLAFALMGLPVGLFAALAFGGRLAEALGTRRLLTYGLIAYLILMPLPAFMGSGVLLFCALALAGLALAIAELGLNVTAAEVESRADRLIMNGCHGFWSVGVLIGSAIGSIFAELRLAPNISLSILSFISLIPLIYSARQITDFSVPKPDPTEGEQKPITKPLVFISLFGFGIAMTEGAMADWIAIFMTDIFEASPGVAGASFTVFSLFVAFGRFQGDKLKARFGVEKLAGSFVIAALAGLLVALFSPTIIASFIGIAFLGLGVSLGFPLAVSAASTLPGRSSASNVAILTQMTLCGFLVGPPVIGLIAEFSSIQIGLLALSPALVMALYFSRFLRTHP